MSVPFGYSDWSNFLLKIINEFYDGIEKQQYEEQLNKKEFLALVNKFNEELGEGAVEEQVRIEFHSQKMKNVNENENYLSLMQKSSIRIFITIIFDPVIETYMEISAEKVYLPSTLVCGDNVINAIRSVQKCLIKLHGTAKQAELIILAENTFNNTYKRENTVLINIIDYLWNRAALLFLGCGLKKDYLIEHLNTLANSSKTNWHYAILPYPEKYEVKKRKRQLLSLKIRPIWYEPGKYEQIYIILQAIIGHDGSKGTVEGKNRTIKEDIIKEASKFTVTNNGNVGTQKTINIASLNGKIIL